MKVEIFTNGLLEETELVGSPETDLVGPLIISTFKKLRSQLGKESIMEHVLGDLSALMKTEIACIFRKVRGKIQIKGEVNPVKSAITNIINKVDTKKAIISNDLMADTRFNTVSKIEITSFLSVPVSDARGCAVLFLANGEY